MKNISNIAPRSLNRGIFVRAYNPAMKYIWGSDYLFDSVWSFERGYRYNYKGTHPVLYLAADELVASTEIGPRTSADLLLPHLKTPPQTYFFFGVKVTASLLDLTDSKVRRRLGVRLEDLTPNMAKPLYSSVKLEVIDNGNILKNFGLIF